MYDALCFKNLFRFEKLCSVFQPLVTTIRRLSFSPRHCSAILDITHWMQVAYALLHLPQCKDKLFSFKSKRKIRIHALMRMQKSIRCLRSMGNIQNGATVTRRRIAEEKSFFAYKKYSGSFIKFRLNHWCQMDFPGDAFHSLDLDSVIYLAVNETVTSLRFYLKYLKLCSEDKQSFWRGVSL